MTKQSGTAPRRRLGSLVSVLWAFSPYTRGRRGRILTACACAFGVMAMKLAEPWPLKIVVDAYFFDIAAPGPLAALSPA